MAAPELVDVAPAVLLPLSPQLQRQLALVFDQHWPAAGACDVDGLCAAVAAFAFEHELVWAPANEQLRREGCRFYPITREGDVRALWFARTVKASPAPTDFERL